VRYPSLHSQTAFTLLPSVTFLQVPCPQSTGPGLPLTTPSISHGFSHLFISSYHFDTFWNLGEYRTIDNDWVQKVPKNTKKRKCGMSFNEYNKILETPNQYSLDPDSDDIFGRIRDVNETEEENQNFAINTVNQFCVYSLNSPEKASSVRCECSGDYPRWNLLLPQRSS